MIRERSEIQNTKKPLREAKGLCKFFGLQFASKATELESEDRFESNGRVGTFSSEVGLAQLNEHSKIVIHRPAGADREFGSGVPASPVLLVFTYTSGDPEIVGDSHVRHQ